MEKLTLDEMKLVELEIMDEIDRVCREHDIAYCLGYGSCLGAVRHGGFIPWDDDMDIVMLRADYERFCRIFNDATAVKGRLRLVSYRDKSAPTAFAKVVDISTRVEERYSASRYESGVWVDVFVLDEVPEGVGEGIFKSCARYGNLRYLSVTDTSTGGSALVRLAKKVACPPLKAVGPYRFAEKLDRLARSFEGSGSSYVADLIAEASPSKVMHKDLFEPIEWDFEGHRFFIPKHYDELLTIWYGDWKTPPPQSSRETHSCNVYRL